MDDAVTTQVIKLSFQKKKSSKRKSHFTELHLGGEFTQKRLLLLTNPLEL